MLLHNIWLKGSDQIITGDSNSRWSELWLNETLQKNVSRFSFVGNSKTQESFCHRKLGMEHKEGEKLSKNNLIPAFYKIQEENSRHGTQFS